MRRRLVAGNWKMHGSRATIRQLIAQVKEGVQSLQGVNIAVCPPFVYLADVQPMLTGSAIALGAQNVCDQQAEGAYTGEINAVMLRDVGCRYVIVGHSERRSLYGETDEIVAKKYEAALAAGLTPILCVGEHLTEREEGITERVIARQLDAVIGTSQGLSNLSNAVIAYEPVWAIGTGRTATPEQAQAVHAFIRARISQRDAVIGAKVPILYGGSVKANNAASLFSMPDIDGGLIGGASLKAEEFLTICAASAPLR